MLKDLPEECYWRIKERLVPDGGLRDIRVLEPSLANWQSLLDFFSHHNFDIRYMQAGVATPLPASADKLFQGDSYDRLLMLRLNNIELNCHVLVPNDLEFDVDPGRISEDTELDKILVFMTSIGRSLKRDVLLTDESFDMFPDPRWEDVICRYSYLHGQIMTD